MPRNFKQAGGEWIVVRLVAADMDGTLLNDRKELSEDVIPTVRKLREAGVCFAIASGRQHKNLLTYFAEIADSISLICVNGSIIYDEGKLVSIYEIMPSALYAPLAVARRIAGTHTVVTCESGAYTESDDEAFLTFAHGYFQDLQQIRRFDSLLGKEKVVQCSVYHPDAKHNILPALSQTCDQLDVYLSEDMWVDIHRSGIDKGTGLRELQSLHHITPDQSMAFGDFLNDIALMQACKYTFAMANSHPDLAAQCRFQIGSNNEDAVTETIKKWFAL